MNLIKREVIANWIKKSFKSLQSYEFVTEHIDEIFNYEWDEIREIEFCLDAFDILVDEINKHSLKCVPMLVLPLNFTEELKIEVPSWNELRKLLIDEPPSLYLQKANQYLMLNRYEEYRRPININYEFHYLNVENISIYYKIYRDEKSFSNDWEFARAIYIEYFPDFLATE
ncbi:MAG: hypothetical protein PVH88_23815 [Ignavibacteria bacterium]|jgi:hypothetical protein